jgi:hypothetical protein
MSDEKLQKLLVQVHEQLQQQDSLADETQVLLKQVLADVKHAQDSDSNELDLDLTERLEEQAVQFEQEYPTVSAVLRQIMDTLGRIGI